MAKYWVVVTDSAEGRIFNAESGGHKLKEIEDLIHSESRIPTRELTSDRPGSAFGPAGGGRHDMSGRDSAHNHEIDSFARQIAERLNKAHASGEFKQLHLSAPPAFLGLLRKQLDSKVIENMAQAIDKNLVHESIDSIKRHFFGPEKHSKTN